MRMLIIFNTLLLLLLVGGALFSGTSEGSVELYPKALYWKNLGNGTVQCELCPHRCTLSMGQRGICKARKNISGSLVTLVYGKAVALNLDPIEKKPLFHVLPGAKSLSIATAGCNMNCNFCQNWEISQSSPEEAVSFNLPPEQVIKTAQQYNAETIAFTYTEPTVYYEYMLETAKQARKAGLKTLLISCGYINEAPLRELAKYLDAANIDLKGFSDTFYGTYTTAKLAPVLATLKILKEEKVFTEITNLVIPAANDSEKELRELCRWIKQNLGAETPLHFSRFFPKYKLLNRAPTPPDTLNKAHQIARSEGLKYVYVGNIDTAYEDTLCPKCGKKLIDREGFQIKNLLLKEGRCPFCGTSIEGIWKK